MNNKLYYSAKTDKYILFFNSSPVSFDALKTMKQAFCELNNIPLDKVMILNKYMEYKEINADLDNSNNPENGFVKVYYS